MGFTVGVVRKNLKKKGFVETQDRHHIYLHHTVGGKKTGPYTYVSHGKKKDHVGPNNIRSMKRQLQLQTNQEVDDLVNCPMSAEAYRQKINIES